MLQRCAAPDCNRFVYYPRVCCPYCGSGALIWERASGGGRIRSYTHVFRPQHESFYDDVPICFVAAELDEGPIFYAELTPKPPTSENLIGRRVRVVFREHARGIKLPYLELVARAGS